MQIDNFLSAIISIITLNNDFLDNKVPKIIHDSLRTIQLISKLKNQMRN